MVKHSHTIRRLLPTNCLSVFDHLVELARKGLICKGDDPYVQSRVNCHQIITLLWGYFLYIFTEFKE